MKRVFRLYNVLPNTIKSPTIQILGAKDRVVIPVVETSSVKIEAPDAKKIGETTTVSQLESNNDSTKQIPKSSEETITKPEHTGNIIALIAGLVFGYLGYLYTKKNIASRFDELQSGVFEIQDVKTSSQEGEQEFIAQHAEISQMLQKRKEALSRAPKSSTKFEDLIVLKIQRVWNRALLALGQQIASAQENRREREEARLRQRILDEAISQGYDVSSVEIKKIVR